MAVGWIKSESGDKWRKTNDLSKLAAADTSDIVFDLESSGQVVDELHRRYNVNEGFNKFTAGFAKVVVCEFCVLEVSKLKHFGICSMEEEGHDTSELELAIDSCSDVVRTSLHTVKHLLGVPYNNSDRFNMHRELWCRKWAISPTLSATYKPAKGSTSVYLDTQWVLSMECVKELYEEQSKILSRLRRNASRRYQGTEDVKAKTVWREYTYGVYPYKISNCVPDYVRLHCESTSPDDKLICDLTTLTRHLDLGRRLGTYKQMLKHLPEFEAWLKRCEWSPGRRYNLQDALVEYAKARGRRVGKLINPDFVRCIERVAGKFPESQVKPEERITSEQKARERAKARKKRKRRSRK